MKIFSGYVREQKRYTKNELKHIFSFDEAGVEKFIKSLKAYGVLKSVKNSNVQLEMSDLVDEDIEITDALWYGGDATYDHVDMLAASDAVKSADMIWAVGGGKATDTGKTLADVTGKPIFTFPTIASNCSACTSVSIMYKDDGSFLKPHFFL